MNSRTMQAPYRLQPRLGRAHEDAATVLAPYDRVGRGRADLVDVGDGQFLAAALAGAVLELGRADAALLLAQLVVELEQVGRQGGGDDLALLGDGGGLAVELLEGGVA